MAEKKKTYTTDGDAYHHDGMGALAGNLEAYSEFRRNRVERAEGAFGVDPDEE